ncbi:MAG: hypothetical protein H0V51_15150 [Chloroflexi bacterium]|nr:hypothetical protein [Chloroflexota bacterium]
MSERVRGRLSQLRSEQGGWTLTELLFASVVGLAVIGAATALFVSVIQSQPRASSRGGDIQQARTTMERITRELRQGWAVTTATPSQLTILTYVKSATCGGAASSTARPCQVTYTCSSSACSRVEANPDGTAPGPSELVVEGFTGPSAFSYAPSTSNPDFVGVSLAFPGEGGNDSITLTGGVTLRNPGAPNPGPAA